ncbi:MAG: DUF4157 domain-containing protein [Myxococcales bacterium]|nr:DUF4157 domain-containing protein [Myxococcales bacterium]
MPKNASKPATPTRTEKKTPARAVTETQKPQTPVGEPGPLWTLLSPGAGCGQQPTMGALGGSSYPRRSGILSGIGGDAFGTNWLWGEAWANSLAGTWPRTVYRKPSEGSRAPVANSSAAGVETGGTAVPEPFATDFAGSVGHGVSNVRLHTGADAAEAARTIRAQAFTIGQHVFFGEGQFAPHTPRGRELLAHELVHTVQARSSTDGTDTPSIIPPWHPTEREADSIASRFAAPGTKSPTPLSLIQHRSGNHVHLDPADGEADKKEAFRKESFSIPTYEPSVGGRFGVSYSPKTGQLIVTVAVSYHFVDAPKPTSKVARDSMTWKWQPDQIVRWKQRFQALIAGHWSEQHVIRCTKPGWTEFFAMPVIRVTEAEAGHFDVYVRKESFGTDNGPSGLETDNKTMTMTESDLEEQGFGKGWENQKVIDAEKKRIDVGFSALQSAGGAQIPFSQGSVDVPMAMRRHLWAFGQVLGNRNPMAPIFAITVTADGNNESQETIARRAHMVATILNGTTRGYPIQVTTGGASGKSLVTISVGSVDPDYVNRRNVATHEFGHLLGNIDEYSPYLSGGLGTLPEGVPDPFAAKKEAWRALVRSAGVQVPMDGKEENTTSQMSAGSDILPAHYVTVWEALGKMTAAYVAAHEWSLGA